MPDLILGHINFINVLPVDVEIVNPKYKENKVKGVPSELNRKLISGEVDIGFFSSVFFLRNKESLAIAGPYGIVSASKAMSVILGSKVRLEDFKGKVLPLYETSASETSVFLNRVILKEYFRLDFETVSRKDALAELLIGDEALIANYKGGFPYIYDIGEYWKKLTSCPAVFAVLTTRPEVIINKSFELKEYLEDLEKVLALFFKNPERFVTMAMKKVNLPKTYLESYFKHLSYRLAEEEMSSLKTIEEFLKNESFYQPCQNSR
jgi:chorismate dehydratase